ncbi:MAG TPA: hypothetical protein VM688_09965 [Nocardioidaceae bacterium]|jgi:hypothetical protein|nr:hypothetical protein [Nocardioidaceae bacterium]
MIAGVWLVGAVILLASAEWFWGLLLLAVAIFLLMAYRRLWAVGRVLDEVERQLRLEEPAANDRDPNEDMNR